MQYKNNNIIYLASPTFENAHLWRVVHIHAARDEEKSTSRCSLNAHWILRPRTAFGHGLVFSRKAPSFRRRPLTTSDSMECSVSHHSTNQVIIGHPVFSYTLRNVRLNLRCGQSNRPKKPRGQLGVCCSVKALSTEDAYTMQTRRLGSQGKYRLFMMLKLGEKLGRLVSLKFIHGLNRFCARKLKLRHLRLCMSH